MTSNLSLEFFWDAVSPYTYLAATQMAKLREDTGATILWRPFFLGGVFKLSGNKPPMQLPAKSKYLPQDLQAWAAYYQVPLTFPASFPTNTLLAMRIACLIEDIREQEAFALALFNVHWGHGEDISDEAVACRMANEAGLDGPALVAGAQAVEAKERLKQNTEEAVSRGAFGAPTFFIGKEMFWGNDRLPLIKHRLSH